MSADPILSEMQQLEERLLHTDFSSQPQQLDALLAQDFEEVSPIGQGTARAQVVQWLLQKNPAHRWQLSQWQVASLSDAVRLVRYHAVQSTPPRRARGRYIARYGCTTMTLNAGACVFINRQK